MQRGRGEYILFTGNMKQRKAARIMRNVVLFGNRKPLRDAGNPPRVDSKPPRENRKSPLKRAGVIVLKFFTALIAVVAVLVAALCAAIWVLVKGPSPTAQRLFVMTVKETSAMGWLANLYLSESDIDLIMNPPKTDDEYFGDTDPSLVTISTPKPAPPNKPAVSDNGNNTSSGNEGEGEGGSEEYSDDSDYTGIELHEITGNGYRGYMMIVYDPKRIFVGTPRNYDGRGLRLMAMIENTGAVAGINGGGFYDPDGKGNGGTPDGIVISDGVLMWGKNAGKVNVIGFDSDGLLHVGNMTASTALELGIQNAVSFGPTLISNGVPQIQSSNRSGINPRTAIGQRDDGAVLLLVVDGRQIESLGATYSDLVDIFLDFGAVNAANLDGGSSTMMVYEGEAVNSNSSVVGLRSIPTAFLVR